MKSVNPGDGPIPPDSSVVAFRWKLHDTYKEMEIARIHKKVECRMVVGPENHSPNIFTKTLLTDVVSRGADWELQNIGFQSCANYTYVVWYFKMKED